MTIVQEEQSQQFEQILRVEPYYYEYKAFAKERWIGQELLRMYSSEYRDKSPLEYQRQIERGNILIQSVKSQQPVTVCQDYIIQSGDQIIHRVHRHEPPVVAASFTPLVDNEMMSVFIKPPGIPVHPAGRYYKNSMHEQIKNCYNNGRYIMPVHRLDRLTSGLICFAKFKMAAARLQQLFTCNRIEKLYYAQVKGRFPLETITVNQKVRCVHIPMTIHAVDPINGKHAETEFTRLAYDETIDQSIVQCKPITGRSHQIRVHLRYLGHPIVNDSIYNNDDGLWSQDSTNHEDLISPETLFSRAEVKRNLRMAEEEKLKLSETHQCAECGGVSWETLPFESQFIYLHAFRLKSLDPELLFDIVSPTPDWVTELMYGHSLSDI
ncbi:hypothetical protein MP228_010428 [Amoeboaphelidium protococcarum]|nr:hypothetical protein MP228_010428 [Amoeboaphelidium protococcarum]